MLASKLLSAMAGMVQPAPYVDDVFSAYPLLPVFGVDTPVFNGKDLSANTGMVMVKTRNVTDVPIVVDTIRGPTNALVTSNDAPSSVQSQKVPLFSSTGFTLGSYWNGYQTATWTFLKASKFFDIVTWTGNGSAGRAIPHNLGVTPGLILVKSTSGVYNWICAHRSLNTVGNEYLTLNTTAAKASFASAWGSTAPTDTNFYVSQYYENNGTGASYVAYLFAHDPDTTNGIIQCGAYTGTSASPGPAITLGWEPQFIVIKSTAAGNWLMFDAIRGITVGDTDYPLSASSASAESTFAYNYIRTTATGFQVEASSNSDVNTSGTTYVYMAIRRPNKPPTLGAQVYNAIKRSGTVSPVSVTGLGFAPDLLIGAMRNDKVNAPYTEFYDSMRGPSKRLVAHLTVAEDTPVQPPVTSFDADGFTVSADANGSGAFNYTGDHITWAFRRAPGVFNIICYTGNSTTNTISHGLDAIPEVIIFKARQDEAWYVHVRDLSTIYTSFVFNTSVAKTHYSLFSGAPTATSFELSTTSVNYSSYTYVAYLFATKAGVSKVSTYVGNGGSLTVDCGFTTGARFIMIKRSDAAGDWFIWDTVRGIAAGNDPYLSPNLTVAEVSSNDSIDPVTTGFIVNQLAATDINLAAATYFYLAFS